MLLCRSLRVPQAATHPVKSRSAVPRAIQVASAQYCRSQRPTTATQACLDGVAFHTAMCEFYKGCTEETSWIKRLDKVGIPGLTEKQQYDRCVTIGACQLLTNTKLMTSVRRYCPGCWFPLKVWLLLGVRCHLSDSFY